MNPPGVADCTPGDAEIFDSPSAPNHPHGRVGGESLKSGFCRTIRHMSKTPTAAPAPKLPATYEAALQELEQLVSRLESGQMPLDELLAGYQRGAALLAYCKDKLQAVEDQIKVLDGGQLKPWDAA